MKLSVGVPPNRERFLAAIAERVAPDRVQALYLFSPIRQGPVETGVAVLACDPVVLETPTAEPRNTRTTPKRHRRSKKMLELQLRPLNLTPCSLFPAPRSLPLTAQSPSSSPPVIATH